MALQNLLSTFPDLSQMEARLYLDDADWKFDLAFKAVTEDVQWESSKQGERAGRKHSRFNDKMDQAEALINGVKRGKEEGLKGIKMTSMPVAEVESLVMKKNN